MSEVAERLPELQQTDLDPATLESLLRDLDELADVFAVIAKPNERGDTPPTGLSPRAAVGLLLDGELRGVQLRYLYQESEWWDTLMRTEAGIRLTRIRQTPTEGRVE